ncbi:MAG: Do family serine endopeptidase [Verrucomicrobiaceae bacterium]|nr:Do family serine endopeptidase [Verrucomicrobiaceae bacterium]
MNKKTLLTTALVATAIGIGGSRLVQAEKPAVEKPLPKITADEFRKTLKKDDSALPAGGQLQMSYASVVEKILPSVVLVTSSVPVKTPGMDRVPPQMREFFRRFYGLDPFGGEGEDDDQMPQPRGRGGRPAPREQAPSQKGTGSGVIVTTDGYILTNNHVVEDADKIEVTVGNGDTKTYTAKVIGTDPMTDVAVLKIDAKGLPAATIGDSSKLRVGDIVLAAGNPMELSQTVTQGIVSAMGRTGMGIVHQGQSAGIENFIQTDAAINPGNSGGPLVDAMGRVIGINTAIMTRTGMNAGIGFSIPINLALRIGEDLLDDGKVSRGFLGVGDMQAVSPEDAKSMGVGEQGGVLIGLVVEDSPAAKAGVQAGDVVIRVGGQHVDNPAALRSLVASAAPGAPVAIDLVRDGKVVKVSANLSAMSDEELAKRITDPNAPIGGDKKPAAPAKFIKGVTAQDLTDGLRKRYEIPAEVKAGVVVVAIEPNTPAAGSGLEEGDVIVSINNKPVTNLPEARNIASKSEGVLGLRISRKGARQFIVIREDGKNE